MANNTHQFEIKVNMNVKSCVVGNGNLYQINHLPDSNKNI
jgi:hypothetical protein